jgi:hypothetical protein
VIPGLHPFAAFPDELEGLLDGRFNAAETDTLVAMASAAGYSEPAASCTYVAGLTTRAGTVRFATAVTASVISVVLAGVDPAIRSRCRRNAEMIALAASASVVGALARMSWMFNVESPPLDRPLGSPSDCAAVAAVAAAVTALVFDGDNRWLMVGAVDAAGAVAVPV